MVLKYWGVDFCNTETADWKEPRIRLKINMPNPVTKFLELQVPEAEFFA